MYNSFYETRKLKRITESQWSASCVYLTEGIYVLVVTKNISKQAFTTYSMYIYIYVYNN